MEVLKVKVGGSIPKVPKYVSHDFKPKTVKG